jgi:hypothetical protein
MTPNTYGIRYLLEKLIPVKEIGRKISKDIVFAYPWASIKNELSNLSGVNENLTLEKIPRKYLINLIVVLFVSENKNIEDLKQKVVETFLAHNLDASKVQQNFTEFIERCRQAINNYEISKRKKEKIYSDLYLSIVNKKFL